MSLTSDLKQELAREPLGRPALMEVEAATTIRFCGGLHLVSQHIVVEAELDCEDCAKRLVAQLNALYHVAPEVVVVAGGGLHRNDRYVIRVVKGAPRIAQMTGLIDRKGRPVRGLPPAIVGAGTEEAVAAWRSAMMARGSLTEPGRSGTLELNCPSKETALALSGSARRLGLTVKTRTVRGGERVVVKESDQVVKLLEIIGASETAKRWGELRKRREARGSVNRLANFDDANLRRSARAAVTAGARVRRALEILGDDVPEHLLAAGALRLEHKDASLEELGQLADPPLTKDAIAGRIRRLLAMADKSAHERGIADTEASLTPDMILD